LTNFEEDTWHEHEKSVEDDAENFQPTGKARAIPTPKQPTQQQRMEHNLAQLLYSTWRPICTKKGRTYNHPHQQQHGKQLVPADFTCTQAHDGKQIVPVLTAIHVETNMAIWQYNNKTTHNNFCTWHNACKNVCSIR
jgi:hypothetical protein